MMTSSRSTKGFRGVRRAVALLALTVTVVGARDSVARSCSDPVALGQIRADARAACAASETRAAYLRCIRAFARTAVHDELLPADCRRDVASCASRSTVGREGYVACGRISSSGNASCRITTRLDGCAATDADASCCEFSVDPVPRFAPFPGEPLPDWNLTSRTSRCFDLYVENLGEGAAPATELQVLCGGATCEGSLTECMADGDCPSGDRCMGHCEGQPCADPRFCPHFVPCLQDADCGSGYCVGAARLPVPPLPPAIITWTWTTIDASYLMNRTCLETRPGSDLSFPYRYTVNPDMSVDESNTQNNSTTGDCFVIG